jgi:hypothetical protein
MPLLALAGLADTPDWILIVVFSIWPFHISTAIGVTTTLTLVGYGPIAVISQSGALLLLIAPTPFVLRSPKVGRWVKIVYLPLGYPLVTLATNLIPGFL